MIMIFQDDEDEDYYEQSESRTKFRQQSQLHISSTTIFACAGCFGLHRSLLHLLPINAFNAENHDIPNCIMDKSYVDYIVDYLNMAYDHYNLKYIDVCMQEFQN